MRLQNYALGHWVQGTGSATDLLHAVTGEKVAEASSLGLDFKAMLDYARTVGGPQLRRLTFHQRALMLKEVAKYLGERKEALYALSTATGATKADSWIDIDGGIGTFYVYASKGRRELPNESFYVDGGAEGISKTGTFVGRHICVPLEGCAVHINAFNFPVWGMMEKLAPSLLAGVPCIVKPATLTSFLTEAAFRMIIESNVFPAGAIQLICGSAGDLLEHLDGQDAVAFTGSASTGRMLKASQSVVHNAVRFNMEADSLNCSILGPDAAPGTDEFDLFVKEVVREMTSKAGQKCTAIRRTIVPEGMMGDVIAALRKRLGDVKVGDPAAEGVKMGPLAGRAQVREVGKAFEGIRAGAEVVFGGELGALVNADAEQGAFYPITLLACNRPFESAAPHDIEAFGPVNTVMPYATVGDAIALARMGKGSLVGSLFTADDTVARDVVLGSAAYHGRMYVLNRHSAKEATGHGSPLPHLVHGGPGRAGGGEEMGGMRGVMHYMQRTAVQGAPQTLTRITNEWITGADQPADRIHPFRKYFEELEIGETHTTHRRTVTEADIVNFACLSGDHFYAHMDEIAAKESIFGRRVAHGYFVIAAAAGLFVDPAPGPVLANYGMENLRFTKPVYAGDTLQVKLTCKQKTAKETPPDGVPQGVVAWDVNVSNQEQELVATYTILTLVKRK
ncbi:MAG: phenylacetic acid degradation bifunctional protein PaaZ [Gemmatimonadaceae bacterium]